MKRTGILIPEFPGQTHNFFWREVEALRELGAEVVLFSTRRPPLGIRSTAWGQLAMRETNYLYPIPTTSLIWIAWYLFRSPARTFRLFRALVDSIKSLKEDESTLRLLMLSAIGINLGRKCKQKGLDHLHVHSCADAANVAFFAHVACGIDYSMTLHNPLSIWGGNQVNKWRHAAFGIVIADWLLRDIRSRIGDALPAQMHIAPMGVNVDVFKRNDPYTPPAEGLIRVFSCARLNPAKGFEVLLESISRLIASGVNVILTIAGEDDNGGSGYRKVLETAIHRHGLNEFVSLLGAVSEERVRAELELAHVFVLASFEEPLGVAIMEAMAMEVPTIATNAGGVPSIISDGVDGVLVPPSDPVSLAAAIARIASNPSLAVELSSNGRKRIVDAFHHRLSAKAIFDSI